MPHRRHLPTRPTPARAIAIDIAAPELSPEHFFPFGGEGRSDERRLRWAIGVAALVHVGLFLLTFPEIVTVIEPPLPVRVIPLRPVRFEPPPPPAPDLPVRREVRVPVPDPTPDAPEPIAPPEVIASPPPSVEPALFGIPEAPPPIADPSPLRVGGDVMAPRKLFAPQPLYPELARKLREQGLVIVEAVVDETGAVTRAKVVKGLRFGLDDAALDAIRRWRFEPATLNGKPVAVLYNLTINFQLR